jgi:hypothetical protein
LLTGDFKNDDVTRIILECASSICTELKKDPLFAKVKLASYVKEELDYVKIMLVSIITNLICSSKLPDDKEMFSSIHNCLLPFKIYHYIDQESSLRLIKDTITACIAKIHSKFAPKDLGRQILYLLIQPEISNFPFELFSYPTHPVTKDLDQYYLRIPNLDIIANYIENHKSLPMLKSFEKWFYIINPQGDCKATEKKLGAF